MPVLFLKSTANGNGYVIRPTGYSYPTGLHQTQIAGPDSLDYLVVAGGGGGGQGGTGYYKGGGGGAGGLLTGSTTLPASTSYSITVGAGGTRKRKRIKLYF
jgi:hypothetical protein